MDADINGNTFLVKDERCLFRYTFSYLFFRYFRDERLLPTFETIKRQLSESDDVLKQDQPLYTHVLNFFQNFHKCTKDGENNLVQLICEFGFEKLFVRFADIDSTPLYSACVGPYMGIVKLLINNGSEVNSPNIDPWNKLIATTPIIEVSEYSLELVKLLLDHGADINSVSISFTPLSRASTYGKLDIAQHLLDNGAEVDLQPKGNYGPLARACEHGHVEVAKTLLRYGAGVEKTGSYNHTPLNIACYNGHVEIVRLLIEHECNIYHLDHKHNTPLIAAAANGHFDVVKLLLENGADISIDHINRLGDFALIAAVDGNYFDVTQILLQFGAEVDNQEIVRGNSRYGKEMLENVNISRYSYTALMQASRNGNSDIVRLLLEHGANINAKSDYNYTALHVAINFYQVEVVTILLKHGADVNAKNVFDISPYAATLRLRADTEENQTQKLAITKLLLDHGCNETHNNETDNT